MSTFSNDTVHIMLSPASSRVLCIRIAAHQIESASIKSGYPGHYQDYYIKVNKILFDAHRPGQVTNMFLFDAHQGQLDDTTNLAAAHQGLANSNSMTLFAAHRVWPLI